ncbi:MAG: FprA family A-type flavoprotein [Myxococcales bacterium]|jgi:flavorubredoxin|nr:FprA family A-type flavoprotein [Myxococcales bacterium]
MEITLRDGIHWVGVIDWNLREFHGYEIRRGTTYNAYLVIDEKTALIDTVRAPFGQELIEKLGALTPLDRIDYVVCNHAEPDHAGSLPAIMRACPNATLVCDAKCKEELSAFFDTSAWRFRVVASGESLSLGKRTLQFHATPMVHWPESMATYVPEEKLLFSMDAFGQHVADSARFDDESELDVVFEEAKHYYANILMPFGRPIGRTLDALSALPIELVAPSHGVIWRRHFADILKAYRAWTAFKPAARVVVIYDSMWGSTEVMARAVVEGATIPGVAVELRHLRKNAMSDVVTALLDAPCIALGSATQNNSLMPQVGALRTYLGGLKPERKAGFFFTSYGWSRKATSDEAKGLFEALKIQELHAPILSLFTPTAEVLAECRAAGRALAEEALRQAKEQTQGEG